MAQKVKTIGVWSGVGIVVANMVGSGVLVSAGHMAMDLAPAHILAAWIVGGVIALAGARAYAALAQAIPRSGGEYRYISDLLHPSIGYLAGWTSLLVGFSMPIAVSALAAGAYAQTLWPSAPQRPIAIGLIAVMTALHALDLRSSKLTQDVLALVKAILLMGFIIIGLASGQNHWPAWVPEAAKSGLPVKPFFISLVYVAYAYSGWNAVVYNAEEFHEPRRDVPRAMIMGCGLVMIAYLAVNWVFVANLSHVDLLAWVSGQRSGETERITLGHLVTLKLVGAGAAKTFSILVMIWLASAVSAMGMVGPRVTATMARDGFLPRRLAGRAERPPVASVILQGALACAVVLTHEFHAVLRNVGTILIFISAIAVLGLFRVQLDRRFSAKPGLWPLVCAGVFFLMSAWTLYHVVNSAPQMLLWMGGTGIVSTLAYTATVVSKRKLGGPS